MSIRLVGTSAGSTVAAQLGSGLNLQELYARQVQPGLQAAEIMAGEAAGPDHR